MIPVLTVSEMREIDEKAIGENLTIGYSYMLRAGMGLFNAAVDMMPDRRSGEIAVLCGKGNNGGDGYVVGRLLLDAGYTVMCFSLCDVDDLRGEARVAFNEYVARKGNFLILNDAADLAGLPHYRLIIDALLGTGLKGDPRSLSANAIEAINSSGVQVLAADTPSGLDNDSGRVGKPCIKASVTVTMGYPKVGLYFHPGRAAVGKLIVKDLNYPDEIVAEKKRILFYPTLGKLKTLLPPRRPAGSKYDHGVCLLMCGSRGLTGSATLVAHAALRTGCGMTHLATPESALPILASKLTETVLVPVRETESGTPSFEAFEDIQAVLTKKNAVCIGPGISHEHETTRLVRKLVATLDIPIVLDADGINAFKGTAEGLHEHKSELVITPHYGEWQRIFGELPDNPAEKIVTISSIAKQYRMTILFKGNPTIVADPEGKAYILPFGNSALATAGSGDVLSGIVVSLIAQGVTPSQAAILGGYIQGEAGTIASKKYSEYSVIASDVLNSISVVIRSLLEYEGARDESERLCDGSEPQIEELAASESKVSGTQGDS